LQKKKKVGKSMVGKSSDAQTPNMPEWKSPVNGVDFLKMIKLKSS